MGAPPNTIKLRAEAFASALNCFCSIENRVKLIYSKFVYIFPLDIFYICEVLYILALALVAHSPHVLKLSVFIYCVLIFTTF